MKKCYTCGDTKEKSNFNKNKSRKDGLNSICRDCSKERSRLYYQENKEAQKKQILKLKRKRKEKARLWIMDYLSHHACVDCGTNDLYALEFDHQEEKKHNISSMIAEGYSIDSIQEEVSKCKVRCANCHNKKTHIENNSYRHKYLSNSFTG